MGHTLIPRDHKSILCKAPKCLILPTVYLVLNFPFGESRNCESQIQHFVDCSVLCQSILKKLYISPMMKIVPVSLALFALSLLISSCGGDENPVPEGLDLRQEMREFVIGISANARQRDTDFIVIPQNGIELVSVNGEEGGMPHVAYLAAIDGNGQEDLFYGYDRDDRATPSADNAYLRAFLDISQEAGNTILVTDYCSTPANMDDSYAKNAAQGYTSFAASQRELDNIPGYPTALQGENAGAITTLSQVQNFLYLINPDQFASKAAFIDAVTARNYDLIIMDLYFHDGSTFSAAEVDQLRAKANGGSRLVIAYMSIGEAEDYRYYWQQNWNNNPPAWLDEENPDWEGNYKVRYWEEDWQAVIFGNQDAYLSKILNAGFDGVYLDIIDAFEYYE